MVISAVADNRCHLDPRLVVVDIQLCIIVLGNTLTSVILSLPETPISGFYLIPVVVITGFSHFFYQRILHVRPRVIWEILLLRGEVLCAMGLRVVIFFIFRL